MTHLLQLSLYPRILRNMNIFEPLHLVEILLEQRLSLH